MNLCSPMPTRTAVCSTACETETAAEQFLSGRSQRSQQILNVANKQRDWMKTNQVVILPALIKLFSLLLLWRVRPSLYSLSFMSPFLVAPGPLAVSARSVRRALRRKKNERLYWSGLMRSHVHRRDKLLMYGGVWARAREMCLCRKKTEMFF